MEPEQTLTDTASEVATGKTKAVALPAWRRVGNYFAPPVDPTAGADDPGSDMRIGQIVIVAFFVIFLGWAAIARVDSAVTAAGSITVTGSRQEVQHKEGGIVSGLHVKEGDHVTKGQVLIDLSGDETQATATALTSQYISLKTQEARLIAEQRGAADFAEPVELARIDASYRSQIDEAMSLQRRAMSANRNFMATQLSVLGQRQAQTRAQISGSQEQIAANIKQRNLTQDELAGVQDLADKGYAPKTRVRNLQGNLANMEGEYGALQANVARGQAAVGELQMQQVGVRKQFLDQTISDLTDTQGKLKTIEPQMLAATSSYDRLHVRATATGKVMGLSAFTVGGVIAPGQKLLDIVPDAAPLVIQALIPAKDGNDVHAGQVAQVRFTSLHERDVPILTGRVLDVSGDAFVDKESGRSFYTARIQISTDTLATLNRLMQGNGALKPGLPVEIVVPLRKRTVLQYLLEPLNQSLWKTFRES